MAKKKSPSAKPSSKAKEPDFEGAMQELETIVRRLEQGGGSLEEALSDYANAITLMKTCRERLSEAERRVAQLSGVDSDGNPISQEFEAAQDESLEEKRGSRSSKRTAGQSRPNTDLELF